MKLFVGVCVVALATSAWAQENEKEDDDENKPKSRREIAQQYNYCEYDNCYELLGIKPDAGPIPIKRAYRRLAAEWHPDKNPDPRAKELFQKFANAHEIISNKEMRANYDYVLAHPYEFPMFYMRYGRPKYAPQSDLRLVLLFTVIVLSAIEYYFKKSSYETTLASIKASPLYKDRLRKMIAVELSSSTKITTKKSGAARMDAGSTKAKREATKSSSVSDEVKAAAEEKLLADLAEELPQPPAWQASLGVAIFKLPLTTIYFTNSHVLWFIKFKLLRMSYGPAEMALLTQKALDLSTGDWESMSEEDRNGLIEQELWIAENLEAFQAGGTNVSSASGKLSSKEKRALRLKKKGPSGDVSALMGD